MARGHCRQDHHNLALAHAGVSIRGRSPGFSFIASRYMIRRANRPGLSGAKIRSIWDGGLGHLPNLRLGLNGIDDDGAHRHILSTRKPVSIGWPRTQRSRVVGPQRGPRPSISNQRRTGTVGEGFSTNRYCYRRPSTSRATQAHRVSSKLQTARPTVDHDALGRD